MAETTSLAFPNMFNIANNQVSVLQDTTSVANRSRLLILSEPTELYNNPNFGVGLKRHLWKYNNDSERGLVKDRITQQLKLHEPCVYPEQTVYSDGLLFTGTASQNAALDSNTLNLTVMLKTTFKEDAKVELNYENINATLNDFSVT